MYPIKPLSPEVTLSNVTPSDISDATNVYLVNTHTADVVVTLSAGGTFTMVTDQVVVVRKEPTTTLLASVDAVIKATRCGIL